MTSTLEQFARGLNTGIEKVSCSTWGHDEFKYIVQATGMTDQLLGQIMAPKHHSCAYCATHHHETRCPSCGAPKR